MSYDHLQYSFPDSKVWYGFGDVEQIEKDPVALSGGPTTLAQWLIHAYENMDAVSVTVKCKDGSGLEIAFDEAVPVDDKAIRRHLIEQHGYPNRTILDAYLSEGQAIECHVLDHEEGEADHCHVPGMGI